ncbi:MAG: DedA family protein [Chloroflexi bacterium]|nr:DedA family protein [Chloroflexota bacterium]
MLADLIEQITLFVESIMLTFGLPGIGLIAAAENLFPPVPSEFLYPLAGKLAFDGLMPLWAVVVVGVVGTCIASSMWYALGVRLGEARVRQFIERRATITIGRLRIPIFTVDQYDRALELFRTRGGAIVLIARILPYVHSVVSLPAGVIRMPFWRFMIYTAIGATAWILPLTVLGYLLGSRWREVLTLMDAYQNAILIAAAAGLAAWLLWRRVRRRAKLR